MTYDEAADLMVRELQFPRQQAEGGFELVQPVAVDPDGLRARLVDHPTACEKQRKPSTARASTSGPFTTACSAPAASLSRWSKNATSPNNIEF
jgi:hypothetical protein